MTENFEKRLSRGCSVAFGGEARVRWLDLVCRDASRFDALARPFWLDRQEDVGLTMAVEACRLGCQALVLTLIEKTLRMDFIGTSPSMESVSKIVQREVSFSSTCYNKDIVLDGFQLSIP